MGSVLKIAATLVGATIGFITGGPMGALQGALLGYSLSSALFPSAKPSQGGSQTKWKADPYAGIPYLIGRTLTSGNIVYKRGHGSNNKFNTFVTVLSLGPIASIDATFMDKTAVTFAGSGAASGTYAGQIWQKTQLGALPEAAALVPPVDTPPGWTSAHKLSGLAAAMNSFAYDSQNKNGLTAIPQPAWIAHGVKVYDPRLDSTYPGGSGSCRAYNEATYVWSENPHLHALTWALGRYHNGKRVAGIGIGNTVPSGVVKGVDVASFVEGANLDDARNWKVGGQVYTRPDTPWNSLKAMLQAGGSTPQLVGGRITAINRAPRVSLATIGPGDIKGPCRFSGTQRRRARINGIIPQYRSEAHDWEMVPASLVQVSAYVSLDGGERTRELGYPLVQQVNQVAQLAAYDICQAREAGPGTVPLGPAWLNYKVGDCLTFAPEEGMSIKIEVTGRAINPEAGTVTLTIRGETDGKHAFALGQTGTAPPIASLGYTRTVAAPDAADWTLAGTTLSANGSSIPALVLTGTTGNASAEAVLVDYRPYSVGAGADDNWSGAASEAPTMTRKEFTSVTPGTQYEVGVRYRVRGVIGDRRILGPVTAGSLAVANTARRLVSQSNAFPLSSDDTHIYITAFTGLTATNSSISFPAATIGSLSSGTRYGVFRNPVAGTYVIQADPALSSWADPALVWVGWQSTSSGGTYAAPDTPPGGYGGNGSYFDNTYIP